jgi:hypothetical protein
VKTKSVVRNENKEGKIIKEKKRMEQKKGQ